jgi:hypothetical protein
MGSVVKNTQKHAIFKGEKPDPCERLVLMLLIMENKFDYEQLNET